ncbi:hypothetical protein J2Z45_004146 [Cohnella lubricantis]|nr:hypothetical protein [Cohnella lubricantis]MBP2120526.1 hypothetical protein [Cohnella lubricantis]
MDPALSILRRVVRVEHSVTVAATQQRLVDRANILDPEFVCLLVPNGFKKALAESQGLDLDWVIGTAEYDPLPGRLIDDLHWLLINVPKIGIKKRMSWI